jgi:hypothetical protein
LFVVGVLHQYPECFDLFRPTLSGPPQIDMDVKQLCRGNRIGKPALAGLEQTLDGTPRAAYEGA